MSAWLALAVWLAVIVVAVWARWYLEDANSNSEE